VNGIAILIALSAAFKIQFSVIQRVGYDVVLVLFVACAKVRLSFGAVDTLNILEAEELLRLCRGGRLYDVEKWIASGKSLVMPPGTRNTPLGIAISMRFHSLA
jgi:hypothetical protein